MRTVDPAVTKPRKRWPRALCAALVAMLAALPSLHAAADPARSNFLQAHCAECHDAETRKGGLDLGTLSPDLATPATFATLANWRHSQTLWASGFSQ